jgi:simple sugar transport system ATP-binding protein
MSDTNELLAMRGITKHFPGVAALSNVTFQLKQGEIHGIVGENGAGKSTLIKVLTGAESLESGEMFLSGQRIEPKSPHHAQSLGISTVYQEVNLCPHLSVAENIFIGRQPMKNGHIDWKEINKRSEEALACLNIKLDVTSTLDEYSVAIQQMVAISRALDTSAKVLILDEPTSSLDKYESSNLFAVMRKLRSEGIGIIFITHFLDQIYSITDRVTVLRNGECVGTFETADLPRGQLVAKMIGRELQDFESWVGAKKAQGESESSAKKTFYLGKQLGRKGMIDPLDISIDKGEVMGLAGLLGSGRTETARLIFGVDKADSGDSYIEARAVTINSPQDAIRLGMGFCPENRKSESIIADLTVRENIVLGLQAKKGLRKSIPRKVQEKIANKFIDLLNISTPGCEQLIKNLSGGNQQKVIIARWLATEPALLILDEPTRGIDIGAKAEIQTMIVNLAKEGMAVLFISSELEEMVRCCEKVSVYRDKRTIGELRKGEISEQGIMHTISGVHSGVEVAAAKHDDGTTITAGNAGGNEVSGPPDGEQIHDSNPAK